MKQVFIKDGFHWLDQSLVLTLSCRTVVVKSLQRNMYPCELWLVNSSSIVTFWSSMMPFPESKTKIQFLHSCGTTSCMLMFVSSWVRNERPQSWIRPKGGRVGRHAHITILFADVKHILHSPQWGDSKYWPHKAKGPSCIWTSQPRFPPWSICYDFNKSAEVGRR